MSKGSEILNLVRDWEREWECYSNRNKDMDRPAGSLQLAAYLDQVYFKEHILESEGLRFKVGDQVIQFLEMGDVVIDNEVKSYIVGDKQYKLIEEKKKDE